MQVTPAQQAFLDRVDGRIIGFNEATGSVFVAHYTGVISLVEPRYGLTVGEDLQVGVLLWNAIDQGRIEWPSP